MKVAPLILGEIVIKSDKSFDMHLNGRCFNEWISSIFAINDHTLIHQLLECIFDSQNIILSSVWMRIE